MLSKKFKCEDDIKELESVSPWLLVILADVIMWAFIRGLHTTVTSILREANDGISESDTHQTGRALDLSVKGWSQQNIEELGSYLNRKYGALLGTGKVGKPPLVCVYHNNGNGWHFHLQVRRIVPTGLKISVT